MVETINPDMWIPLKNKYKANCCECGIDIAVEEDVLWKKGIGVKHKVCEAPIIQELDKNKKWKDDKTYTSYDKIMAIKECQRCGVKLGTNVDKFVNCDRRVCEDCFSA